MFRLVYPFAFLATALGGGLEDWLAECSVHARPFVEWASGHVARRDASHGMEHFMHVRRMALDLSAEVPSPTPEWLTDRSIALRLDKKPSAECACLTSPLLLELTALAHDIRDHKYGAATEAVLAKMLEVLGSCGLSPAEAQAVIMAAENVSLSRQLRGEMQAQELFDAGALWLRDVVSDADKLDALGVQGLQRMVEFEAEVFGKVATSDAWADLARRRSKQFAEYRADHLVFDPSRRRAEVLLKEMRELLGGPDEPITKALSPCPRRS